MVRFSHLDPGTPEGAWMPQLAERDIPAGPPLFTSLVVVSAHPDDETLGVGGLIHLAREAEGPTVVLVATDGEGSHPASRTRDSDEAARRRREETAEAVGMLDPAADLRFVGIPDGAVDDHRDTLAEGIRDALDTLPGPVLVVSPWRGDGHRDHRVVAEVTAEVSRERGATYRGYPIWMWHWASPDEAPWPRMSLVPLDDTTRKRKSRAVAAHRSQTAPLSPATGDEPILHAGMLAHFDRPFEVLIADEESSTTAVAPSPGSTSKIWFDDLYARHEDPWGFDSRWYEQRKRDLLLAALPRLHYSSGLELGCSTGALTRHLADRVDRLLAVDVAEAALQRARRRLDGRDDVQFHQMSLPAQWPDGHFDLIVLSELGYYWDSADLDGAVEAMRGSLAPGGHILACHWRHPVAANPITGDGVHVVLRTTARLHTLVHHEEEDFVLDVFGDPSTRSVAAETGMLA